MVGSYTLHEDWKINPRISQEDCYILLDLIKCTSTINPSSAGWYLEKKLAMTLYHLKDQGLYGMTCNTYGCAKGTLSVVLKEICNIISEYLGPQFIRYPTEKEDILKAKNEFLKTFGFPQTIGCVDGTHIPIKQPVENAHDYFSYKMKYTINCQAICDHKGQFIDVEIYWPGCVHDARVFANSNVQKKYLEKTSQLFYNKLIPGEECVPQVLLGYPAYPLLPYLMKEYESCSSNEEVIFNTMLRSARNQIECTFGLLKSRWRILQRLLDTGYIDIYTCFVLHNFVERNSPADRLQDVEKVMIGERANQPTIDRIHSYHTRKVRESITKYFNEYL